MCAAPARDFGHRTQALQALGDRLRYVSSRDCAGLPAPGMAETGGSKPAGCLLIASPVVDAAAALADLIGISPQVEAAAAAAGELTGLVGGPEFRAEVLASAVTPIHADFVDGEILAAAGSEQTVVAFARGRTAPGLVSPGLVFCDLKRCLAT